MRASSSSSKRARPAASETPPPVERADAATLPLGYRFANADLLRQALTHRSYGTPNYERLEFIGDAVLDCVVALALFERFPATPEGDLSRARAHLVNQDTLAHVARRLDLGAALRLGEGELKSGGADRASILADSLEAVFGAVFLDGGFDAARATIDAVFADVLRDADPGTLGKDPKTRLQEWLQARHLAVPEYVIVATSGEAHAQRFDVECRIAQLDIVATGSGPSRRAAEQASAQAALEAVKEARRG
jgi:ribonuclease-3